MSTHRKHPKLSDKDWLVEQYFSLRKSTCQISKEVGCTPGAVVCAINKHGLKLRNYKKAANGRKRKGFRAPELNDPEILKHMYHIDLLNTYEIASIFDTNQNSVMSALIFHEIERRSLSDAAKNRKYITTYYPKLHDKDYLYKKYIIEKKSSTTIAKRIGCRFSAVIIALCRLGIPIRTNSEAQKLLPHFSMYKKLNNKNWLKKCYIDEGISTNEIAKKAGAPSCNSARQSLIRAGIEVRNYREAQIYLKEGDDLIINHDVIDGGLLGDAGMGISFKRTLVGMPYHWRKNKYYDHIEWVGSLLYKDPIARIRPEYTDKYGYYWILRTLSNESLLTYFRRWYPEKTCYPTKKPFEKIIPDDVCISRMSMLHTFLDDGTQYRRRYESNALQVIIVLCLEGFTPENLEVFRDKANRTFNSDIFRMRKYNQGYGYRISVRQSKTQDFYSIIGPPPVKCLAYKWKYAHNFQVNSVA